MNNIEIEDPFLSWTEAIAEPQLEFDESDLHTALDTQDIDQQDQILNENLSNEEINTTSMLEDINGDNYEEQINKKYDQIPQNISDNWEFTKYNIINVYGDDKFGRKVITISACNLPNSDKINYELFTNYIRATLDKFVELDYALIYFHHGLTTKNKPPLGWLWHIYKLFDRNYKKNLKQVYVVHPSNFIKIFYQLFKSTVSNKFADKIIYINSLQQLQSYVFLDQIYIPNLVIEYDHKLFLKFKQKHGSEPPVSPNCNSGPTHLGEEKLKQAIEDLIQCLSSEKALTTVGIFRRSCSLTELRKCKTQLSNGVNVKDIAPDNVHLQATLLKTLLRDLPEPLTGVNNYETISNCDIEKQDVNFCREILDDLPPEKYDLLNQCIQLFALISSFQQVNKMSSLNLGLIFGPNLVWSRDQPTIQSIYRVNHFVTLLIDNYQNLFNRPRD